MYTFRVVFLLEAPNDPTMDHIGDGLGHDAAAELALARIKIDTDDGTEGSYEEVYNLARENIREWRDSRSLRGLVVDVCYGSIVIFA